MGVSYAEAARKGMRKEKEKKIRKMKFECRLDYTFTSALSFKRMERVGWLDEASLGEFAVVVRYEKLRGLDG
jgi:hypothetical protein